MSAHWHWQLQKMPSGTLGRASALIACNLGLATHFEGHGSCHVDTHVDISYEGSSVDRITKQTLADSIR